MEVYVTGGTGLVGTAFKNYSCKEVNFRIIPGPSSGGPNFCSREETFDFFIGKKVDALIHTAAKVGGVKANIDYPLDFFSQNVLINTNILDAASSNNIDKCISFLSTCVYPDKTEYPLKEKNVHAGSPHDSNFSYAYSKRMLDIHSRSVNEQLGYQYFCVSPNNLYGINDNFDKDNSHVIPGMIVKMFESKIKNEKVILWGDGSPLREFTFANDIPDMVKFLLFNKEATGVINIGNSCSEISIKKLSDEIKRRISSELEIVWDKSKPKGQFRKPSCNKKIKKLGYDLSRLTSIEKGLDETISWFLKSYPNVRGIT